MNSLLHKPDNNTTAAHADVAQRLLNLLDTGEVTRFHAVPTVTAQTVGHHTFGVLAILMAIGCFSDPKCRWLLAAALLHDAPELYTGDIPFTTKRANKDLKLILDRLEAQAGIDYLFTSPRLTPRHQSLLKLADMLEGLRWCLAGHERGRIIVAKRWAKAIRDLLAVAAPLFSDAENQRIQHIFDAILGLEAR